MADAIAPQATPLPGLDRTDPADAQDVWDSADIRRGHLRVRTLVRLRWVVVAGQVGLLALMAFGLGYRAPYIPCAMVVMAGALVNVVTAATSGSEVIPPSSSMPMKAWPSPVRSVIAST